MSLSYGISCAHFTNCNCYSNSSYAVEEREKNPKASAQKLPSTAATVWM